MPLDKARVGSIIRAALDEDAAESDITVRYLGIGSDAVSGAIVAGARGVVAGIDVARWTFEAVDRKIHVEARVADGDTVEPGAQIAVVSGPAAGVLSAERVALNFLQRLSGIATLTASYVARIVGTGTRLLDTRKTTPMYRELERYAVRVGGGQNHRFDLSQMVLVKENHVRALGGVRAVVERLKVPAPARVEVEVDSLEALEAVLGARVDRIMLDNFAPERVREAVSRVARYREQHPDFKPEIEVSGGVTLDTIDRFAIAGVDFISVGALTHSAPALPMSLEVTGDAGA